MTEGAGFTAGYQQMLGAWIAYKLAGKIGNKENSANQSNLLDWFNVKSLQYIYDIYNNHYQIRKGKGIYVILI